MNMTATANICLYNEYQGTALKQNTTNMETRTLNQLLAVFLREQQKQAYAIALVSVQQESDALDVIQEAMMAFVKSYSHKPQDSWRPLFYRILQNKINDHHRRQKSWLRNFFSHQDKDDLVAEQASEAPDPLSVLDTLEQGNEMISVIKNLPRKQQQVIMYRHWQQMTVNETAEVMQISTGSVKTHLFRATQKIKSMIGDSDE